ncbi:MAG: hypothetical protein R3E79_29395 [Caldilineaceae bacterium]
MVDFAHFGFLNPASLQPLADALADRGVGLRYWISQVDTMALESSAQFPDQSADLATQLKDASALIVVSPFFLWTPAEIAVTERFVADGGRLLLISDPDINGDFPSLLNILAEPFGVVFNDDYLYDTTRNDGNFTFFFVESAAEGTAAQDTTTEVGTALADATIAFYGGRSISGAVIAQMRSAATTASSLRNGQSGFITVAIGGVAGRGTQGRVLALSDFDVLTEAYRVRHDNQRMVEFVADFLSADQRNNTMADFPNYLGKEVALAYGAQSAIDANLLAQGAQLQQRLEETGRTLTLTNGRAMSNTSEEREAVSDSNGQDLIYLADYTTAFAKTTLLTDLGIQVITEAVTITIPVEATPVAPSPRPASEKEENSPDDADEEAEESETENSDSLRNNSPVTTTVPVTPTATVTPTQTIETADETADVVTAVGTDVAADEIADEAPTAPLTVTAPLSHTAMITPSGPRTRVEITTYLETAAGLRFLADETVLVAQRERADGALLLAVLGADRRGIDTGVTRLLTNDFKDCVLGQAVTFCSLPPNETASRNSGSGSSSTTERGSEQGSSSTSNGNGSGNGGNEPEKEPAAGAGILLVDDNRAATDGESSEADLYLQTLIGAGHSVDLWSAKTQGSPTVDDLDNYAWVVWSNAGYANGKLSIDDMDLIFGYIRQGGRLTVSSRFPLPGIEEASTIRDVVIDNAIPALVDGLSAGLITLTEEQSAANLTPLAADESGVQIALRRGSASDNAEAPVVVALTDAAESDNNARFMIVGMALTGLPEEARTTLISNMATWMLTE